MTHPPIAPSPRTPLASDDPGEDRTRGPYEITIVTHASEQVVASVTLPAETSLKRAKQKADDYLATCEPGASATVHQIERATDPSHDGALKYSAHLDKERIVRAGQAR